MPAYAGMTLRESGEPHASVIPAKTGIHTRLRGAATSPMQFGISRLTGRV